MHLPFGLVINYAHTKPKEMEGAGYEFFGSEPPSTDQEDDAIPLFGEWLIYDFKQDNGITFLAEYCLKNPDNLTEDTINKMIQVAETNQYSQFEIRSQRLGEWIELEDLKTGEVIKIWDTTGSSHDFKKGTLHGRRALIDSKWCFVGANPIYMPVTNTQRMKKFLRKTFKDVKITPKDTWELIKKQNAVSPEVPSIRELPSLRKKLKQKFVKLTRKYSCKISFKDITDAVYKEDRADVSGFWQDLIKKGLAEELFFKEYQLFNDIWNFFPHRCLDDKSPLEVFVDLKGKT